MRFLPALVMMIGCGGGGDRISSIDPSRLLSSLSKDEAKQYCRDMAAFRKKMTTAENQKLACGGTALASTINGSYKTDAEIRAACTAKVGECMKSPPKDADQDLDCDTSNVLDELVQCTELTVGDMSACATEMSDIMHALAKEDSCATVEASDPSKAISGFMDRLKGPKCAVIETKCRSKKGPPPGSQDPGSGSNPRDGVGTG